MGTDVFLCVITGRIEVASPMAGERINRIYDVEFPCLTKDVWDFLDINGNGYPVTDSDSDSSAPGGFTPRIEQNPCYELRKILSDGSFYYSTDFDLTSTLQGRGIRKSQQQLSVDRYHMDYMWNAFMMKEIIHFRNNLDDEPKQALDSNRFLTTVIRGFAESVKTTVGGKNARLTIVSKQSWKRTGTRFNVRGIDDDGNVANFVETECILNDGLHAFAYTQIRGSIPLFWEQDTALVSPKVQVTRSFDASQPVFEKHFANLNGKYGPVHIVNLLSKTKSSEVTLSRAYKEHFRALKEKTPDSLYFTDFDFHQETSKTYADADRVLRPLKPSLQDFGYFCYDLKENETIMEQQGVFRTNCLDCLDRTNVVQQVISRAALDEYMADFNMSKDDYSSPYVSNTGDVIESPVHAKHSVLWADHGDQISQIYTGTNALKSSFSRSGKMGFAGALSDATKSLSRIYINNFVDKGKQVVIDTLLGKNSNQMPVLIFDPVTEYLTDRLHQAEPEFTTFRDISIFAGTFNLSGASQGTSLAEWLFPEQLGTSYPDIYLVGFQEVIELNASSILKNDGSAGQYWKNAVQKQLDQGPGPHYVLLRSEYMSSILLLLFVKEDEMTNVTQVEGKSKKTGLGGMTANKGSVAIRFNYGSTSFCLFNSHLASGVTNTEERFNDFLTCWNGIRFSRNRLIKHHDNVVWTGDLNYRVSLPNEDTRALIEQGMLAKLLSYDQLGYEMKRHPELQGFTELPITFPPTYKFDKLSDNYDTSEKQRVPSWTDRIMFQGDEISQLYYQRAAGIRFSDHRPVFGSFSARVKLVNSERKHSLTRKFLQEYKSTAAKSSGSVLIELNVYSGDEDSFASSTWSSTNSAPTLIDLSAPSEDSERQSSEPPPPIPRRLPRRVPPPFDAREVSEMVRNEPELSGISSPIPMTDVASAGSSTSSTPISYSVMRPTRSRAGTSLPPLPPRESTTTATLSTANRPVPPVPRKSTSSSLVPPVLASNKEAHKVPPLVPVKPKSLNVFYSELETDTANEASQAVQQNSPPPNQWMPMAPTKRR
ncbi:DEKNAAC103695 [Brettanomyces naardenensis]|uniref:phosphoinositide 5-phosphatase n=1 Tax=Brettanomyces naardenensis TaxID=13370 RepID=A0A448YNQ7_BRENA|nr:DEKNAAC103695 [Brettanomyces naardenensis]